MKFLLVLLVVLVGVWLWRRNRLADQAHETPPPDVAPSPAARAAPAAMVACARCGVHLPAAEALPGRHGSYCSADHRQRSEGAA